MKQHVMVSETYGGPEGSRIIRIIKTQIKESYNANKKKTLQHK
jgi:uncharacterized protein YvpB